MTEGFEQAIEADGGGDVELDLDFDNGSFRIETEEGTLSVDGEAGEAFVTDASGEEVGSLVVTEDGAVVTTEDETWTLADEEGRIAITDSAGEELLAFADDGIGEVPTDWRTDLLPVPDGAVPTGHLAIPDGPQILTYESTLSREALAELYGSGIGDWAKTQIVQTDSVTSIYGSAEGEAAAEASIADDGTIRTVRLTLAGV